MTNREGTPHQHSSTEIYDALMRADVVAVATHEGMNIKQRQMHFAVDKELNLYFATMKGDPKTLQITNDPKVSLLILDRSGDMQGWSETELNGNMEIITDDVRKTRASSMLYERSPIVKNLVDYKQDHILEWIAFVPHAMKFRVFGEIVQGLPPTIKSFGQRDASLIGDLAVLRKRLQVWYMASRAQFLVASLLPILLGVATAFKVYGEYSVELAVLSIVAGGLLHLGANLFNDYFDHLGGSDVANVDFTRPFTGGSRVIQLGLLSPATMLASAILATVCGLGIGTYLAIMSGPALWAIGVVGLAILLTYSLPRFGLASLGFGEISIGVVFGPLMALGAYYVQTSEVSMLPVFASLPLAVLIALILFINEFPDRRADEKVGKNTLVVRMGLLLASRVYLLVGISGFLILGYLIAINILPPVGALGLLGLLFIVWGWRNAVQHLEEPKSMTPTCAATVSAHLLLGIALVLAFATHTLDANMKWGVSLLVMLVGGAILARYIARKKDAFDQAKQTFAKS